MKAKKLFSGLLFLLALGLLCPGPGQADYLTERWTSFEYQFYQLDTVKGSPAVGDDGSIYARTENDYVFALHPDGTLKWVNTSLDGNYFKCDPAIAPSGAIIIHNGGHLYALDPLYGGIIGKVGADQGTSFDGAPAVSTAGIVYVGSQCHTAPSGTPTGAKLYAFDLLNELKRWEYTVPFPATSGTATARFSNPVIGLGGTIYCLYEVNAAGQNQHALYAIKPDGTFKASREFDVSGPWTLFSPAIGPDGTIYVVSDDYLFALNPAALSDKWVKHMPGYYYPSGSPIIGLPVAPWETYSIIVSSGGVGKLICIGPKVADEYATFLTDPGFDPGTPAIDRSGYVYFGTSLWNADQGQLGLVVFGQYEALLIEKISLNSGIHSSPAIVRVGPRSVVYICESHALSAWNNTINGVEPGLAHTSWPCDRANLKRNGRLSLAFSGLYAVAQLKIQVEGLQGNYALSLGSKLDSVKLSLEKEDLVPARNKLNAFINEVSALRVKKIPERAAAMLIIDAQNIVNMLP